MHLNDEEHVLQDETPCYDDEGDAMMAGGGEDETPLPVPAPPHPPRMTPMKRGRPIGNKCAKDEERQRVHQEHVARAQGRVSAKMATASRAKAQVLEDQSALHIFTMPVIETLDDDAREYLALRRKEELLKIRVRVAEREATLAREEAARKKAEATAARERAGREEEIDAAVSRRNPPPPPRHPSAVRAGEMSQGRRRRRLRELDPQWRPRPLAPPPGGNAIPSPCLPHSRFTCHPPPRTAR
jgi:hypothetical protein